MTRKLSPALLAILLVAAPVLAQQTVNLRDADVRAFIQDVSRATGRTFIIDPRVQGKVSVVSERPLDQAGYFELFLSTLRANGLVVTPAAGGAFRVAPADGAATQPSAGQGRDRFETAVLNLNFIDAASAIETLRPLVSREGQVTANRAGNAVIIADYADNVARVRQLARQIDQDRAAVRVVALKHAGAREIATSLAQIAQGSAEGRGWQVAPVDASNSLVLRGDPATLAKLARTVADLDQAAAAGSDVRVFFLNHADAEKLVPVLQQLVGQPVSPASQAAPQAMPAQSAFGNANAAAQGQQPAASAPLPAQPTGGSLGTSGFVPGASIGRGQAVIARYEGANAIVIAAPADVQRRLGEVIRQLDVRREQVLVEAIIVEISDIAAQRLGVQFLLSGTGGSNIPFSVTNYSNAAPNLLAVAGAIAAEKRYGQDNSTTVALRNAAVNSLLNANGGQFGFGGNLGSNAVFGFVVNAVKADTASNVLSTPSVMTLDNAQARILVGQNVPLATGQALSNNFDNAFRTVQRQDIGIALDVRPQINAGGTIKLTLRQEVSSIATSIVTQNIPDIILNKREINTTVTVDDGQIIALGGLIDENERRAIEKVPLLGDIPFLGNLFRSRSRDRTKTNLMVFIRPTIIRNAEDAAKLTGDRYQYVRAEQARREATADPSIDALVRDYLKAPIPGAPAAPPRP
ncbi:type II secretion system secretin GspD [Sandarakinorhabdus limnophila]|jgi:general secretion pathway protein D|uniref:type II secretion system secretin GspD n=1 Tax=Sandarakinorhabdus limnophila TaxID=210512 RepID=UPI0023540D5D|nr:type II secretion system secretin GspD [Sandarakinorhabdus limnophila]